VSESQYEVPYVSFVRSASSRVRRTHIVMEMVRRRKLKFGEVHGEKKMGMSPQMRATYYEILVSVAYRLCQLITPLSQGLELNGYTS
jgi:hypothetical protein